MSATPDLILRRLSEEEKDLALGLAASVTAFDDSRCEAWGIAPDGAPPSDAEPWGLFVRGTMAGAAWFSNAKQGTVEIAAMALPRGRWGMGLVVWMAGEASRQVGAAGAGELLVRLESGGRKLGELLEDAGFFGPDVEDENYPRGEWRRLCLPSPLGGANS